MSNSVRPQRQKPTRLPHPWDSPGKNTGVGCHFLLQCMKVKSESEVAQSCPPLSDPMDCSRPGSSVHGIFQVRGGVGCHRLLRGEVLINVRWKKKCTKCCKWAFYRQTLFFVLWWICWLLFCLVSKYVPVAGLPCALHCMGVQSSAGSETNVVLPLHSLPSRERQPTSNYEGDEEGLWQVDLEVVSVRDTGKASGGSEI